MKLTTLIVSNGDAVTQSLKTLCEKSPALQLVSTVQNFDDCLQKVQSEAPDLLLFDFDSVPAFDDNLVRALPYFPHVIGLTALEPAALPPLSIRLVDTLTKPFTPTRFVQAVETVMEMTQARNYAAVGKLFSDEVFIKSNGHYNRVEISDILYCEKTGEYISVKTTKGNHLLYLSMKELEEKLSPIKFMKVHRSFIVNVSHIKNFNDTSLVIGSKVIPISRAHRSLLSSRLNIL